MRRNFPMHRRAGSAGSPAAHQRRWRRRWSTVAALAVLSVAACSGETTGPTDPFARQPGQVYFYGTDGNMLNGVGALVSPDHPNAMAGMKGTTPLTPLSASFIERLRTIDPGLRDYSYAGESYDAVVISALAAQTAGSTNPRAIAAQINGVTVGGTPCDTVADCFALLKQGKDIAYRGITLGLGGFTDAGEPSASTYGVLRFSTGNQLDIRQTQYVPTGDAGNAAKTPPPAPTSGGSSDPLRIGALMPHTGALASAGPPLFAAALLAVKEINAAGGVLGRQVQWFDGDDYTDPEKAVQTANRLITENKVQVIIGAGASSISLAVLPTVMAAGVILFSPSNTSAELTTVDDQGLYFRTAPPDGLQAAALTDVIMRDGVRRLSIIARDDSYGKGLAESVKSALVAAGLSVDDVQTLLYNPDTSDFTVISGNARSFDPDGVLLVAFDETANIFDALLRDGFRSITK
jgi:ABC-type branched-subunit amino acid transport system substrate-binding protein